MAEWCSLSDVKLWDCHWTGSDGSRNDGLGRHENLSARHYATWEGERFVFFLKVSFETLIEMLKHHKNLKGDIGWRSRFWWRWTKNVWTGSSWIASLTKFIYILLVTHLCPTLWDPMYCSQPGFSVHGILQPRILEWVAIPFPRGSSWPGAEPRSHALQADSLPFEPPGSPICILPELNTKYVYV